MDNKKRKEPLCHAEIDFGFLRNYTYNSLFLVDVGDKVKVSGSVDVVGTVVRSFKGPINSPAAEQITEIVEKTPTYKEETIREKQYMTQVPLWEELEKTKQPIIKKGVSKWIDVELGFESSQSFQTKLEVSAGDWVKVDSDSTSYAGKIVDVDEKIMNDADKKDGKFDFLPPVIEALKGRDESEKTIQLITQNYPYLYIKLNNLIKCEKKDHAKCVLISDGKDNYITKTFFDVVEGDWLVGDTFFKDYYKDTVVYKVLFVFKRNHGNSFINFDGAYKNVLRKHIKSKKRSNLFVLEKINPNKSTSFWSEFLVEGEQLNIGDTLLQGNNKFLVSEYVDDSIFKIPLIPVKKAVDFSVR